MKLQCKMMFGAFLSLGIIAVIGALAGCGVRGGAVANEPPVIKRGLVTFASDYGQLKPESISFFFWPTGMTEDQTVALVSKVNKASVRMDELVLERAAMVETRTKLESQFSADQCITKWADLGPEDDPDLIDWVTKWKTPDGDGSVALIKACAENQDQRRAIGVKLDQNTSVDQTAMIKIIYSSVDPGYPDKIENMKSVDAHGSSLKLSRGDDGVAKVEITLRDFIRPGNTLSTESTGLGKIGSAQYTVATKLLVFSAPELDEKGATTGARYQFSLERAPNFMNFARFRGDVKLMRDNQVIRYGSFSIEGQFAGE